MWKLIRTLPKIIATTLILHFDGSLRIPSTTIVRRDDETILRPHHLLSPSSPIATCAAALLLEDGRTLHSLGGKPLLSATTHRTTSADAEYEGLILGLNHLLYLCDNSLLPSSCDDDYSIDDADGGVGAGDGAVDSSIGNIVITIRGDCKTIIDHLNQSAIPRKQREYYTKAKGLIDRIIQSRCTIAATGRRHQPITFRFEHVPRNENVLCDYLCKTILFVVQKKAVKDVRRMTNESEANVTDLLHSQKEERMLPRSKKKRLTFDKTPFVVPLGYLSKEGSGGGGHVPLYARPELVFDIAIAAIRVRDPVAMRLCGRTIAQEADLWQRLLSYTNESTTADTTTTTTKCRNLKNIGRSLEYAALHHMELYRDAEKIGRKLLSSSDGRPGEGEHRGGGGGSESLFVRAADELNEVRSLLQLSDTKCVNLCEVTFPHSEWYSIVDDWYRALSDVYVEPKSDDDYSLENGRKKLALQSSVWLI